MRKKSTFVYLFLMLQAIFWPAVVVAQSAGFFGFFTQKRQVFLVGRQHKRSQRRLDNNSG